MSTSSDNGSLALEDDPSKNSVRQLSTQKKQKSESETSEDESDVENGMVFIRHTSTSKEDFDGITSSDDYYISPFKCGSDSENEDGVMEKLASAIGHIFTGLVNFAF